MEEDIQLLDDYYAVEQYTPERLTPWLLRLVLDDRLTVDKHITMDTISNRIRDEYEVRNGADGQVAENLHSHCMLVLCERSICPRTVQMSTGLQSCWFPGGV